MAEFTVRLATRADVPEVLRLQRTHAADRFDGEEPSDWQQAAAEFLREGIGRDVAVSVAQDAHTGSLVSLCVGVISQVQPAAWLPNGRLGYLQSFYTEPQWRNIGVGESVLDRLIEWFLASDADRLHLHANDAVRPYFEKKGFRVARDQNLFWPGLLRPDAQLS